jgi:hypothetical protein
MAIAASGTQSIAKPTATTGTVPAPDLLLLFRADERPDGGAVRAAVQAAGNLAISHDAAAPSDGSDDEALWVEILADGMTFDLAGIAPGPAARGTPPAVGTQMRNRYEVPTDFAEAGAEALSLAPGPHLRGGQATIPVVRAQAALGAALVRQFSRVEAVAWVPARTLVGRGFFLSTVEAWLAGGPFPALGLTAFRHTMGGALQSEGLAFFTGQELHFEHGAFPDPVAATQLGMRLVNELVGQGPVATRTAFAGPDGAPVVLEPSRNGRFLRVGRG